MGSGATLRFKGNTTIFLDGEGTIEGSMGHESLRPALLKLNVANGNRVTIDGSGIVCGRIYNPDGDVHHHGNGQSYGSVISALLCFRHNARGHSDVNVEFGDGTGGRIRTVR